MARKVNDFFEKQKIDARRQIDNSLATFARRSYRIPIINDRLFDIDQLRQISVFIIGHGVLLDTYTDETNPEVLEALDKLDRKMRKFVYRLLCEADIRSELFVVDKQMTTPLISIIEFTRKYDFNVFVGKSLGRALLVEKLTRA